MDLNINYLDLALPMTNRKILPSAKVRKYFIRTKNIFTWQNISTRTKKLNCYNISNSKGFTGFETLITNNADEPVKV